MSDADRHQVPPASAVVIRHWCPICGIEYDRMGMAEVCRQEHIREAVHAFFEGWGDE